MARVYEGTSFANRALGKVENAIYRVDPKREPRVNVLRLNLALDVADD
jgi:hypothetical protein